MKNAKDFSLYKNFLDLIPDPIIIIKKKDLKIFFANLEFQVHFEKSLFNLKDLSLNSLFSKESFLISSIRELESKVGMFLIKEAALFKNFSYEVRCIIPENINNYILMIFKKNEDKRKINEESQYTIFDETFSILSHEINNPLSSVRMAAQIMSKSKKFDSELVEIISNEVERISKVFKSLNYVNSKINLVEAKLQNIHEILRYSVFRLRKYNTKIKVIEDFDPSLPLIKIDKDAMIQVFDNLLINSMESLENNSFAYIKITSKFLFGQTIKIPNLKDQIKQNFLSIIIEDNGVGISENDLKKVFIPFFSKKKMAQELDFFW